MIAQDVKRQAMEIHYQQDLLRAAIESQEKERTRIAHDLHDDVGMLSLHQHVYQPAEPWSCRRAPGGGER